VEELNVIVHLSYYLGYSLVRAGHGLPKWSVVHHFYRLLFILKYGHPVFISVHVPPNMAQDMGMFMLLLPPTSFIIFTCSLIHLLFLCLMDVE
jgi:hypothetical protein